MQLQMLLAYIKDATDGVALDIYLSDLHDKEIKRICTARSEAVLVLR